MKRILLPTDFSENAWNATEYALQLFAGQPCTFYFLNTYTPSIPSSRFMMPTSPNSRLEEMSRVNSEKGLEKVVNRARELSDNPDHVFDCISSFNLLVEEVNHIVEERDIDLIVTGTKGASGMEEVFMGSNTVRIIKSIKKCPILAIPQYFLFAKPKEIAFATDFRRFYSQSELKPLLELAAQFEAVIRIVYVQHEIRPLNEVQEFNLKMLRKFLGDQEHFIHTVSELASVSQTLELFTQQLGIHLLALLNYPHSYVERVTHEPIVKRTAFHTQIPLLVIPELGMEVVAKPTMSEAKNAY